MSGPVQAWTRRDVGRRAVLAAGAGLLLSGCTGGGSGPLAGISIAGGDTGGAFVRLSRLLGVRLEESGRVREVRVLPSAGAVENVALVASGRADLAPAFADSVRVHGSSSVVAVAKAYETLLHCLVRDDSGIEDVADLAGRRLAIGPAGSGTADSARRLLDSIGVEEPREGAWREVRVGDGAIALAGGAVDALFWWGGRPAPEIEAVAAVGRFRALDLATLVDAGEGGVYRAVTMPTEFYGRPGTVTVGVACQLVCRRDVDPALVRTVIELVQAEGSALVPQPSNGLRYFAPATLYDTAPVPLHPAAVETYRSLHG